MTTRVLIVDDSPTARRALQHSIEEPAAGLEVVAVASTTREALTAVEKHRPDIITLDVHLGNEDGVALATLVMQTFPTPIVVVTGIDAENPALAFRAMQAGALEVLPKLPARSDAAYAFERQRLVRTLDALSRVPLVTRRPRSTPAPRTRGADPVIQALVIGSSTGGPPLLQEILGALPRPFPVPICIAQHIVDEFAERMAEWLGETTGHAVSVCDGSARLVPGTVYLAQGSTHLVLDGPARVKAIAARPDDLHRPSIDALFESAARCLGDSGLGLILTGMGKDGSRGALAMKCAGAAVLAQEPATCIADSMPVSAITAGAVDLVLSPTRLPTHIVGLVSGAHRRP